MKTDGKWLFCGVFSQSVEYENMNFSIIICTLMDYLRRSCAGMFTQSLFGSKYTHTHMLCKSDCLLRHILIKYKFFWIFIPKCFMVVAFMLCKHYYMRIMQNTTKTQFVLFLQLQNTMSMVIYLLERRTEKLFKKRTIKLTSHSPLM